MKSVTNVGMGICCNFVAITIRPRVRIMNSSRSRVRVHKTFATIFLFFLGLFFIVAGRARASETRNVIVSILPQKYFVEQIAGNRVHVTVMVPPGANPATYEPKPSQMKALSEAQLYFSVGVPFEKAWLPRFRSVNPKMTVVDTRQGIKLYPISSKNQVLLPGKDKLLDPHIWLSPPLVIIQARNILQGLSCQYPELTQSFRANFHSFANKIVALDIKLMDILIGKGKEVGCSGRAFMVFHPSWGYFARAYGLRQIPVEQEGKEPKPSQLVNLMKSIKKLGIKVILVQPQFSTKAAQILAESTGVRLVVADPLAYEWDRNLLEVAKKLRESWK